MGYLKLRRHNWLAAELTPLAKYDLLKRLNHKFNLRVVMIIFVLYVMGLALSFCFYNR